MKYIKTLILAAVMVASAAPADPPVFSQQNNCCWIASWVQIMYNFKPLIDRLLGVNPQALSDPAVLNAYTRGRLATETLTYVRFNTIKNRNEFVYVPALDYYQRFFKPNAILVTNAYRDIFTAMRTAPQNQNTLNNRLEALQRLLQKPEKFGEFASPQDINDSENFVAHPVFTNLVTRLFASGKKVVSVADGLAQHYSKKPIPSTSIKTLLLVQNMSSDIGLDIKNSFILDLTPMVTKQVKNSGQCLKYDLIGIGTRKPGHYWAFIKDQYDPAEQWWRCDTLSGNRRVTEQEIITECTEHPPLYLTYKVKDCKGQAGDQNNQDVETLARVLWELGK